MIGPEGDRLSSANIPCIHGRALARELTERLGLPVDVINDANAFGLAESVLGCGAGHRVVFAAILGTGIGGAVVIVENTVRTLGHRKTRGEENVRRDVLAASVQVARPVLFAVGIITLPPCTCARSSRSRPRWGDRSAW